MKLLAAFTVALVAILGASVAIVVFAELDVRKQKRAARIRRQFNR